jgi:hypothetical protein
VLATVSSIWISSAMTIEQAQSRLLPQLTAMANRIADAVGARA